MKRDLSMKEWVILELALCQYIRQERKALEILAGDPYFEAKIAELEALEEKLWHPQHQIEEPLAL